jgi:predicted metal-dependent hydrolase
MRCPDEAIDCVVVHELAHIVHKNHGKDFYALINSVMPDYKLRKKLLKTVGSVSLVY